MNVAEKLLDKELLRNLIPLDSLSDAHLTDLARKSTIENIKSGKYLFRQGKRDPDTWYLLEGEVALMNGKTVESLVVAGTEQARNPLAPELPRQYSARATTPVRVVKINTSLLDVILSWDQSQSSQYEVTEIQAEEDEDWMTRMLQSDMFQRLSASNIQQLIMKMEEIEKKAGDIVVSQNDEGDYYYIIKSGRAEVIRKPGAGARLIKIAELRNGDSFGEEALLSGGKRNATIRMMTDGKLMRLSKENFDSLLREPLVEQLDYAGVREKLKTGAMVIDVRLPGEFQHQRLDPSINLPVASIRTSTGKLNKDRDYIIVCDTGTRSASAAFLLKQLGFNTYMLAGGLASVPEEELLSSVETVRDVAVGQSEAAGAEIIDFKAGQKEPEKPAPAADKDSDSEREQANAVQKELQEQLQAMRKQLAEGQQKLGQQQARLTQLNTEEEDRRASIDNLGGSLEAANLQQQEIAQLKNELEQATGLMKQQAEQLAETQSTGAQRDEEVQEMSAKLKAMQARLREADDVIKQKNTEQQVVSELQKELEQAREQNRRQQEQLNKQLSSLQEEITNRDQNMVQLQTSMEEKQQALKTIETEKATEIDGYEQRLKELESKLAQQSDQTTQVSKDMRAEIAAITADRDAAVQGLQSELELARQELEQFNQQLSKSVAERQQAEQSLDSLQSELADLRTTAEEQKQALEKEKLSLRDELESAQQALNEKAREFEQNEQLLQEEKASLQDELEQTREALVKREQELATREQESQKSQEQLQHELELAREALAKREQALEEERTRLEQEREQALQQERDRLEREREEQLQKERQQLEQERENALQQERDRLERERQEQLQKERQQLEQEREQQLEQERQRLEHEREEQLKQERERLERERTEQVEQERERLEREREEQLEQERSRLLQEKEQAQQQKDQELQALRAELDATRTSLEEKTQELDRFAQQHQQAIEAKQQLEETINQSHLALQQVQQELEEKQRILEETENQTQEVEQQRREEVENLNKDVETLRRRWEKALTEKEKVENAYDEQASLLQAREQNLQNAIDGGKDSEEVQRLQDELDELKQQMSEDDKIYQRQLESLREELLANNQSQLQAEIDKARAEAEEEVKQLRRELEEANQSSAEAQAALREREMVLDKQQQELAGLQAELDMAQQQGEDTEHLRGQMKTLRKAMQHEVETHKEKLEEAMFRVKQENTELRRELEGFYRDAELASEIGGPASGYVDSQVSGYADSATVDPLDVKDLGGGMSGAGGPLSSPGPESILEQPRAQASPSSKPKPRQPDAAAASAESKSEFTPPESVLESTFDSSDIFSLADMDANLFSEQQEQKKSGKGKLIAAGVLILAAGGAAAWWFLGGTPAPTPAPTPVAGTPTPAVPARPATPVAVKPPVPKPVPARPVAKKPAPVVARKPVVTKPAVSKPATKTGGLRPGRIYRDALRVGGFGPVMVQVPGGSFRMGSPTGSTYFDERPQHPVSVKPISVGRFEVTFAEYDRFARATGRARPSDNGWGRGKRPVINVSWSDARAYAAWLSKQTGHKYRLPTEAEWEYFARAGTSTRYWWGRHPQKGRANCFNCGSKWDARQTAPVGSFRTNALSLYDVSGNALEWVQDCYRKNYTTAPTDGSAVTVSGCRERVARGGSYRSTIKNLRVTRRYHFPAAVKVDNIGFRVVREK